MSTEIVADKYSSAMLELAQEQGNLVTTEENLLYVASVLNEQPELVGFINNPIVEADAKISLLGKVFGTAVEKTVLHFMYVMVKRGRYRYLQDTIRAFIKKSREARGILEAIVTVAEPLTDTLRDDVQAKLQAILRRTYSFSKDFHLLTYQDVHLDILAGKITYQQKELILTKNELKILEYLFEHAEVIVSRVDLMNHLWDDHQFIDDNTLSVNMNRLRKKLEDIGLHDFIHTKKGLGYLLCLKTI